MKVIKNRLLILIFAAVLLAVTNKSSFAQTKNDRFQSVLSVSPVIIETDLNGKKEFQIKVKNLLPEPLGISTVTGELLAPDQKRISGRENSLSKYTSLSGDTFIIEPGKTKNIDVVVNTPSNLKDGGYYEAIYLTPFFQRKITTTTILTKVAVLVLGTKGTINYSDLASKTEVKEVKIEPDSNITNSIDTQFSVSNDYFTHFTAKPFLKVTPLFGKEVSYELSEKKILPGTERSWSENIKLSKSSIFNKATLAVSVGQGNFIYKDSYFINAPIKEIFVAIIFLGILIFIKLRGKYLKRAVKVLLKG